MLLCFRPPAWRLPSAGGIFWITAQALWKAWEWQVENGPVCWNFTFRCGIPASMSFGFSQHRCGTGFGYGQRSFWSQIKKCRCCPCLWYIRRRNGSRRHSLPPAGIRISIPRKKAGTMARRYSRFVPIGMGIRCRECIGS